MPRQLAALLPRLWAYATAGTSPSNLGTATETGPAPSLATINKDGPTRAAVIQLPTHCFEEIPNAHFHLHQPPGPEYDVTGPDGATVQQAFGILQQHLAQGSGQPGGDTPQGSGGDSQYQLVNVPGVGQLRFPAGMSQQDMAAAIQRNFPQIHGVPAQPGGSDIPQSGPDSAAAPDFAGNFVPGVGKALVDVGRGAKELALKWGNKLGAVSNQHLSAYEQQLAQDRELDAPLMNTTGGKVGELTGNVAMAAVAPEEAGLAGAAGMGAALGGLQPATQGESQTENALVGGIGGIAGAGVGKVAGKLIQPIANVLDNSRLQAVQLLRQAGVPLDVSQATGSGIARALKTVSKEAPLLSPSKFGDVQQAAYNNTILRSFGASGTKATPTVMDGAARRIGAVFDDIASRNPVTVDSPLLDDLANLHDQAGRELSATDAAPIHAQIDNVIAKAADNGGRLDGSQYQNIRSSLGRLSTSPNGSVAHFAGQIRSSLDDALERSASGQDLDALMTARRQYRAMSQAAEAIDEAHDFNPSALYNVMGRKSNAAQSVYGRGDQTLQQLADAGKLVLSPGRGSTPLVRPLLTYGLFGGAGDIVYRLARGQSIDKNDLTGVAITAGLAPMAARALTESPAGREWLTKWANSTIAKRVASRAVTLGGQLGAGAGATAIGGGTLPAATQQPSQNGP